MHRQLVIRRTGIGSLAILMWSALATLTTLAGGVPPFQLTAIAFGVAAVMGYAWIGARGVPLLTVLRQPLRIWLLGIFGLFGYHLLYFMALSKAPPVEASLIAYLWPLLIVLFSAMLPGETLRWFHLAGALLGFCGAALLITNGSGLSMNRQFVPGYLLALTCGFVWASYSVLSRKWGEFPTSAVAGFCGATAALALACHLVFESTVWPQGRQWLAVLGLGVGPLGVAFFAWDYGIKNGDIRLLGAASYAAPLLSTALLIAVGLAEPSWYVVIACVLIVSGALLAGLDLLKSKKGKRQYEF